MKKLISVAAFLAASSALATAADGEISALVHLSFDNSDLTNDGTSTNATVSGSGLAYSSENNFPSSASGASFYNTTNGNFISVSNAISWDSAWTATFAFTENYTTTDQTYNPAWKVPFAIGTNVTWKDGKVDPDNTFLYLQRTGTSGVNVYGTQTWTNDQSSFLFSGDSFKVLTMTYEVADGTSTFKLYGDGELASSLSVETSALANVGTTIDLGGREGASNYLGCYDEFAIYDAALTQDQIQKNLVGKAAPLTISTIPEPSAFGLLAGVGALALVAARRRRSRKA